MGQMYEVTVSAIGEVRDKDGNLKSAEPVEATIQVTEEELQALRSGASGDTPQP